MSPLETHPQPSDGVHVAGGARVLQAGQTRSARIESLRAVAALAVLECHVFAYAHGWRPVIFAGWPHRALMGGGFGVELFFALSGYLMYRPFARRDFAGHGPVDLKTYARNRALRILPLYYAVMAVLLVATQHGGTAEQWWRFSLFAESFSTRTAQTLDGPMWSLVVELHFYILLPVLAVGVAWVARRSRHLGALTLLGIGAPSLALHYLNPRPFVEWQYSLPETFFFFVPGMLLALAELEWRDHPPSWIKGPIGRTDTWLVAAAGVWAMVCWRYSLLPLLAVASGLAVAAVVLPLRPGPLVRLLDLRPLVLVGLASYSLYLWHVPIIEHLVKWSRMPAGTAPLLAAAVPLSLAAAAASYLVIERPALSLRRRWENVPAARPTGPADQTESRGELATGRA